MTFEVGAYFCELRDCCFHVCSNATGAKMVTVCLFLRIYTTWILSVFIFVSVAGPWVFPRERPCVLCTRQLSHVYKNRAEQEGRGSRRKVCNARCERSVVYINMSIFDETGTNVQLLNVEEEQKLQSYYASIDSIPIPMLGTILY